MTTCTRCGQQHTACKAHNRAGGPCKRHPPAHQDVCNLHGAKSPQALTAAAQRADLAAAQQLVVTLGLSVDISPTEALLEEVRWTAGHVRWLRERIQELEAGALVWGVTRVKEGGDDRGTTMEAKPHAFYALYASERAHLVTVSAAAIKAGVEERKVRLAEGQGALVADVIRRILVRLQLTDAQTLLVGEVVPQELRALAEGPA